MSGGRRAMATRGAILLTVLLTGLALLLLALAGSTLALLHLQAARHAERAQHARIAARSGLEVIDVLLAARFRATGSLPLLPPALPAGHDLTLRIVDYERLTPSSAAVEVEGGSDGAVARVGARLAYP